jgi:ATP-dependent protease ClpP protease subunit
MPQTTTSQTPAAAWYSIRQKTPVAAAAAQGAQAEAEIFIYGDIGESWYGDTIAAAQFVKDIGALSVSAITIRINSFGGSVSDGTAIYNAIKRHSATVTTVVDGVAMSIASLIAMAGDTVEMAENAVLMVHAPWTYMSGNSTGLREAANMLDQFASAMATSYAAKTGKPVADMLALLTDGADHYYTAAEAKEIGFIDNITTGLPIAASASMRSQAATRFTRPVAEATQPQKAQTMHPTQNAPAAGSNQAATPDAAALQAAVQAALAADGARREAIHTSFAKFADRDGVATLRAACQNDTNCTDAQAGQKLLALLGSTSAPVAGHTIINTVHDESEKHREAMVNAVLARASIAVSKEGPVRVDASNPYRGRKLLNLAEMCLARAGIKTDGMDQRAIVASAFTQGGSDFPILLENVMHKTLLGAYALQADTWTLFCARGSVSDFRAHNRYRVGSLSNLDSKTELGEYRNKSIPDGEKASIAATTKGNIINISREAVINDDMGTLTGLASSLGRAAKRTVEADVYAVLALNSGFGPTLADGKALFHADHNNVGTGAPTVAAFEAARVILSAQKDVSGNDFLALSPDVWLGPDSISGQARVVNNSTYDPDAANKLQRTNIAANMVGTIVGTPRLSGTPWFIFAAPSQAPVLEVAFLDGIDTPYLELENGFSVDGARWKVRMDYGIAGLDYRGAVRSTGA